MINQLVLIRNVGRYDSVNAAANLPLGRLALIYAENGRGKTTLAAILRSLATGDAIPIVERRRLASLHPPHVIIRCAGGPPDAMFQNGQWNRSLANMVVFDDVFIDQNVYSGLGVEVEHRKNLHELILGARGVALNQQLQDLVAKVEAHSRNLRQQEAAVPVAERGGLTIDQFCALPANPNVAAEIEESERHLAAAHQQEPIRKNAAFELIEFPAFEFQAIEAVLRAGVPELDAAAAARVQEHLATLGRNAEGWLGEGIRRQAERSPPVDDECVFCGQNLSGSTVMGHYRAYFSSAYQELQRNINVVTAGLTQAHSDSVATVLERSTRIACETRYFWSRFSDMPHVQIDTPAIIRDWQVARDELVALLIQKRAAPLESIAVPEAVRAALQRHEANLAAVDFVNQQLRQANQLIAAVKQRAASADPALISRGIQDLKTVQYRQSVATSVLCGNYLAAKQQKSETEVDRDAVKVLLDQYRTSVFPIYQAAINRYLMKFNAGYHLDSVTAVNTRGGPTCSYSVVINDTAVSVGGGVVPAGEHGFRNTLSAGDRNTLALAFFFASIELDPNRALMTVVIDDPVSSLDEHRCVTTVQEIRKLVMDVSQVIVLSHSRPFLCSIWEHADRHCTSAVKVARDGSGSTIETWSVDRDCVTEHDRRHETLREFVRNGGMNAQEIARSLRPMLEAFLRVAYPEYFPPGTLLGQFRSTCERRIQDGQRILNEADAQELRDLIEYTNQFHHENWQTVVINDIELAGFGRRTLGFVSRP